MKNKIEERPRENKENRLSEKTFDQILRIALIAGIIIVSGFTTYYLLNPEPGSVSFGILNEDQEAGNYPTTARAEEKIYFYVTVGNNLSRELIFTVRVLKGDETTELSASGSEGASFCYETPNKTLDLNQEWISEELSVSFLEAGDNQLLIVELWELSGGEEQFNNILWLRINITAS